MQGKPLNISDLIRITEDELQRHGVSVSGLWRSLDKHFSTIRTWFIKAGTLDYSDDILEQYVLDLNKRWDESRIARKTYTAMLLAADRLREVAQTGKLEWGIRPRGTRFRLGDAFETLLDDFGKSLTCAHTTKGDVMIALRDLTRELIQAQLSGASDESITCRWAAYRSSRPRTSCPAR